MMVEGFRKLHEPGSGSARPGKQAAGGTSERIKGTRLSLHSSLQQTSSGIQSLDLILGNGINLASSLLVQEQDRGEYTPLFAKHFISEGLTHDHVVVCVGERVHSWVNTLPKPIQLTDKEQVPEEDLKIAWRYKRKIQERFSHSYDLSQHRPPADTASCHLLSNYPDHDTVLKYIRNIVQQNDNNVVRIVLDRPFFPVPDEPVLNRFHYNLHQIVHNKRVVLMCIFPSIQQSETLTFSLSQYFNYVLTVKSLPKKDNSVYKDYHGILQLDKVGNTNTFTMPLHDLSDRFFKIKRKKFIIEKMHLPPDLSETVSRSAAAPVASKGGCGSGSTSLDF